MVGGLALGLLLYLYNVVVSLRHGAPATDSPWGSATLEWATPSPPPWDNFPVTPAVSDPYDYSNLIYDEEIGGFVPRQDRQTAHTAPVPSH